MSSGIFNQYTGYHNRRSIRLRGYNYSQTGYYFVTICIHDRTKRLFGDIPIVGAGSKPAPLLTEYGTIVQRTWHDLPNHINGIALDEFIVMPNHVHGIIRIVDVGFDRTGLEPVERTGLEPAPTGGTKRVALTEIVRQFKTFSAKRINGVRNSPGVPVWQRNYYEQIIRDEKSLFFIRKYIRENPLFWNSDLENHVDKEIKEFAVAAAVIG
jgi:putative transposase